jgi:actin related protein 2/3 complex subunit 2
MWSPAPPLELKGVSADALNANAGFVTFGNLYFSYYPLFLHETILPHRLLICAVVYPRHVEGKKLDRTVWNLLTFHAYVSYHVKVRPFNLVSFVYIELLGHGEFGNI